MNESNSKLDQALKISDEIISNIENEDIPFEKVLLKCTKLARLRDDFESIKWFTVELHGYGKDTIIPDISREDFERFASMSGRYTVTENSETKKEEHKYWTPSVTELEADIQTSLIALENLKPPGWMWGQA